MRRIPIDNVCRNPRCLEALAPFVRLHLCPSCRLAGAGGAALAFVVAFLVKLAIAVMQ